MNCAARVRLLNPRLRPIPRRVPAQARLKLRPAVYKSFRQFCERLLRIPHDPTPPPGDEAATRIFRAAPNFYNYLLFVWGLKTVAVLLLVFGPFGVPLLVGATALGSQGNPLGWLLLLILTLI